MMNLEKGRKGKKKSLKKILPLNILVVDDELEICKMLTKYLSIEGHRVKYALTGKEAIKLIKLEDFEVVLLDIVMPGISSMDVLSEIKKISPKTEIMVITGKFLSTHVLDELKQKGVSGFLQKPFKIEEMIKIIGGFRTTDKFPL